MALSACLVSASGCEPVVPIRVMSVEALEALAHATDAERLGRWASSAGFTAKMGTHLLVPAPSGALECVVLGVGKAGEPLSPFFYGKVASQLPDGFYAFADDLPQLHLTALAFALEMYSFNRYRSAGVVRAVRLFCRKISILSRCVLRLTPLPWGEI